MRRSYVLLSKSPGLKSIRLDEPSFKVEFVLIQGRLLRRSTEFILQNPFKLIKQKIFLTKQMLAVFVV
jgi:hypothetical protein